MSVDNHDAVLDALVDSLSAYLPERYVERSLADPAMLTTQQRQAGFICLVAGSGGEFANYRGREADLGSMKVTLVGFLEVTEGSPKVAIERAELALLGDCLRWLNTVRVPGLDVVYPDTWKLSQQLEHPFGWVSLSLEVRP